VSSLLPACTPAPEGARIAAVDLMRKLQDAERRPASAAFELGESTFAGQTRATIIAPAESRLTWRLFVPRRGTLQFYAAVPATGGEASIAFRIGISDNRRYQTLTEPTVTSSDMRARGWIPVTADLSPYAGRKWSVFYRPDEIRWTVVIGTHVVSGAPGAAYIGSPAISTDVAGAREYATRVVHQEKNRQ
jgi:hypothetical protein